MSHNKLPIIGITMGDPAGIGPEVVAKSLAQPSIARLAHYVIIGDAAVYRRYARTATRNVTVIDCRNKNTETMRCGTATAAGARAALAYIDTACRLMRDKKITAIATAPVCKETISSLGQPFHGHTEYIADYFRVKKFGMMFVGGTVKVLVATRHIPLASVNAAITKRCIAEAIALTAQALKVYFKIARPTIAVCGINPHAGEGGKIGKEEIKKIIPSIKKARAAHIDVRGPFAADTLFYPNNAKQYDAIIAMYHDQGLIPIKTMSFNELVNLTVGLPFVRTSPAHGTAFAIAGKNIADHRSMAAAIKLAAQLSR